MLALYYVYTVSESEVWQSEGGNQCEKLPLLDLLKGKSARNLLQVLVMMSYFWLTQNIITIFSLTGLLLHTLHLSGFELTLPLIITYFVLFFSYIDSGILGQRIGRRRFFLIVGLLIATLCSAILWSLIHIPHLSFPVVVNLVCLLAVLVTSPWGVIVTYITWRFVMDVRAMKFGIGFSLSVILSSLLRILLWIG